MTFALRNASPSDAQALCEIYNAEVLDSTVTFDIVPRTLAEQVEWINSHSGAHGAIVAVQESDGAVIGFSSLTQFKSRAAYSTSVENSIYVHREHQGKGLGKALLDAILESATETGFHACFARIEATHQASIGLHASRGFEVVGIEREVGRKFGRWLDVMVMQKLL